MNWTLVILTVAVAVSLTVNGFLAWLVWRGDSADKPLVDELRGINEILRDESRTLHERIELMAASVPHIRLVKEEEQEVETVSNLEILDDDKVRIGNKGAGVV